MRTAVDCLEVAQRLSECAEKACEPLLRQTFLTMAGTWVELSAEAEWQDGHPDDPSPPLL
jgi:hypothetical protein